MKRLGTKILLITSHLVLCALLARAAVPASNTAPAVSFVPVDVYLDTGTKHLGAYQLEISAKNAAIVGLEGGDAKAFSQAPYYDPAALQQNRIIVASFSTDADLPAGLTRVATLHFMVTGDGVIGPGGGGGKMPAMESKLVVATDADGKQIDAQPLLREGAIR